MTRQSTNTRTVAEFIVSMRRRELPDAVLDTARLCLADWLGVALGAREEPPARIVHETAAAWQCAGRATALLGGSCAAPVAALCNGTLAHCLDFDDTYVAGVTHISAPVWAAVLAVGEEIGASEDAMLRAYIAGFEAAARAGYGLGELVTARGWHGTGVFGRIGATAGAASLLALDVDATVHALGAGATQAGGLTASFGTMAKPFHAGKAAMDGVLAAQLASRGFHAAETLLDSGDGLDRALVQDGTGRIRPADFSGWEILNNSFKPYAACHLTHPAIDAAKVARTRGVDPSAGQAIRLEVGPLAKQVTGEKRGAPATGLEAKFDLKYCVALALHGHSLSAADFREPFTRDAAVAATAARIETVACDDLGFASARLHAATAAGTPLRAEISVAKGHPGNPIDWHDMREKFGGLLDFAPRAASERLFAQLQAFGGASEATLLREAGALARRPAVA